MSKAKGQDNLQRFQTFLERLRQDGSPLPAATDIARECEFDRQVLYKNSSIRKLWDKAKKELGQKERHTKEAALEVKLDSKSRRIKKLEETLVARNQEIELLRKKVRDLEQQVQFQDKAHQFTLGNGRRVIP
jgi:SMC interacting uncharacterized protein involved in chromosome segregation